MMYDRRFFLASAAAAALAPHLARAADQAPLRMVVPFSAGSGADILARVLADAITTGTGRAVVVDNKAGAGGVIGALEVARARPDGNTVLYTTGGFTTNAVLMKKLPFDPVADFTPISRVTRASGFALLVSEKSPYKTLHDFVADAMKRPGRVTYGSSGIGNTTHVIGALFCKGVGVDLLHIPFKGTPFTDLIAQTVDSAFVSPSLAAQQIRSGQLRALGISGDVRSSLLPDTPTFAEAGYKVQDIPAWSGVWGPGRMTPAAVQSVYAALAKVAKAPAIEKYMRESGGEPEALPPAAFEAYVTSEIERYRRVLPPLGIELGA
ncbi:Argininosuccinate lyase [Variovorax sp. PBS-H4]|uniref:tripartite tricarboxylate transporter substrate binding protein n=1 Tax=Variovorax sp. PBS-H4 TaxID=434008 RepID=UPI0013196934|nr:tripartite tricarboxylate transporter substrate binding protein [Variovorax sp. PBS-H4]VTU28396.1 Argininosuccinate lyase [Variovorax sp. PBS-H4]